jgi:hypothetical protein
VDKFVVNVCVYRIIAVTYSVMCLYYVALGHCDLIAFWFLKDLYTVQYIKLLVECVVHTVHQVQL